MRIILAKKTWYFFGVVLVLVLVALAVFSGARSSNNDVVTATVDRGNVEAVIAISGFVESKNTADLAFPTTGKVTEVFVDEGAEVKAGEVLATLASDQLVAERNEALAALRLAEAQYDETVAGPTSETRTVSATKIQNARANLAQITDEYDKRVTNALRTLLSTDLEARAVSPQESATPPTITGTYTCDSEGTYTLEAYNSGAPSGYSYTLKGLSTGSYPAYTDQPASLDGCGLYIQFADGDNYGNSEWTISIPNTRSSYYVTNKNAYELALKQQASAVAAAENALDLALKEADLTLADARTEVVSQRQAAINQAYARIAAIDARLVDRSIVAPFDSVVTDVSILTGETASLEPVITVLADGGFELTARVPEIDITHVGPGQRAAVSFDAKKDETYPGTITFVSPVATEIDGVAYFKTTVELDETPSWIRAGLNADIDITLESTEDTLRIPERFLITEGPNTYVLKATAKGGSEKTMIGIEFTGNDGYVAVSSGLTEGDTVIAPN